MVAGLLSLPSAQLLAEGPLRPASVATSFMVIETPNRVPLDWDTATTRQLPVSAMNRVLPLTVTPCGSSSGAECAGVVLLVAKLAAPVPTTV